MFERFTDRARRVVVLAQEEARLLDHSYIGTEHLLLGLIHEGNGVAAKALAALGIRLDSVRTEVEGMIGRGKESQSGHIPFTPRAKKVMELSLREALQLGDNYIGTEHLLLGLIREGEGVAAQVLVRLGADLNRVRQQVIQLVHNREPGEVPERLPRARAAVSPAQLHEAISLLRSIDARLANVEQHLGLIPAAPPAAEPPLDPVLPEQAGPPAAETPEPETPEATIPEADGPAEEPPGAAEQN